MVRKDRKTFHVVLEGPANAVTINKDSKHVAVVGRNGELYLIMIVVDQVIDNFYINHNCSIQDIRDKSR